MQKSMIRSRAGAVSLIEFCSALAILNIISFVKIPFTLVPLVLLNIALLFFGALLGKKKGVLLALALIVEKVFFSIPIFAAPLSGIAFFLSPTFGYIFGYVLGAYATGALVEKGYNAFFSFAVGALLILVSGTAYLSLWIGLGKAIVLGFFPFIIPDLAKIAMFGFILKRAK